MENSNSASFEFAFNDIDFFDRVVHIQIVPNDVSPPPKLKKLKRISSPPQTRCRVSDSSATGVQLKSLHLNSAILAAKSPFFYKLFKNGMSESQQKEATLRINSSEEIALMDLLKFMYTKTLSATSYSDLVDVLMAADKFGVKSCVKYCMRLLLEKPMSLKSALLYLDLPSTVLAVEPLIDASKQYLVAQFKDLVYLGKEAVKLPLPALEIVLGSEGLQVDLEDDVYEFILKWARANYPKLKERQEIFIERLARFIYFPYMSCSMLKKVLVCRDFKCEQVSKLVMEALFHKAEASSRYFTTTKTRRLYNFWFVKVLPLEFSLPRCVIFFNLKKEECRTCPSNVIFSEYFQVGEKWFYLGAECINTQGILSQQFGINMYAAKSSKTCPCTLDIELAVMKRPSNEYEIQRKQKNCARKGQDEGDRGWDLFEVPWNTFISDESDYFIDSVLHVRAELTLNSLP